MEVRVTAKPFPLQISSANTNFFFSRREIWMKESKVEKPIFREKAGEGLRRFFSRINKKYFLYFWYTE
jgi:hypothetical protein